MKNKTKGRLISCSIIIILLFSFAALTAAAEDDAELPQPAETPASAAETPPPVTFRPFPEWMDELDRWPDWLYTVDVFPEWFYELPSEPVWFRTVDKIPAWFYSITEIPAWFYPEDPEPAPEMRPFPGWMLDIPVWPDWIYTVDEFPDWFFDLPAEPVWFRTVNSVPAWFYSITVIPGWFYADETPGGDGPPDDGLLTDDPFFPGAADTSMLKYRVDLGNNLEILCSVPGGMTVSEDVYIMFPADLMIFTRDGAAYSYNYGEAIGQQGNYILAYAENPAITLYSFTIITLPVNDMTEFTIPEGLRFNAVFINNEIVKADNPRSFAMTQDGRYKFIVSDEGYENEFTVEIILDTVTPELVFYKINEAGGQEIIEISDDGSTELTAPVIYALAVEEDCLVDVRIGGTSIGVRDNTLNEPGLYRVTVTDVAGNSSSYEFRILYIVTVPLVWVIVISSVLIFALTVYLVHNRRNIKIR